MKSKIFYAGENDLGHIVYSWDPISLEIDSDLFFIVDGEWRAESRYCGFAHSYTFFDSLTMKRDFF